MMQAVCHVLPKQAYRAELSQDRPTKQNHHRTQHTPVPGLRQVQATGGGVECDPAGLEGVPQSALVCCASKLRLSGARVSCCDDGASSGPAVDAV